MNGSSLCSSGHGIMGQRHLFWGMTFRALDCPHSPTSQAPDEKPWYVLAEYTFEIAFKPMTAKKSMPLQRRNKIELSHMLGVMVWAIKNAPFAKMLSVTQCVYQHFSAFQIATYPKRLSHSWYEMNGYAVRHTEPGVGLILCMCICPPRSWRGEKRFICWSIWGRRS